VLQSERGKEGEREGGKVKAWVASSSSSEGLSVLKTRERMGGRREGSRKGKGVGHNAPS
jgi:hypothetical protein